METCEIIPLGFGRDLGTSYRLVIRAPDGFARVTIAYAAREPAEEDMAEFL